MANATAACPEVDGSASGVSGAGESVEYLEIWHVAAALALVVLVAGAHPGCPHPHPRPPPPPGPPGRKPTRPWHCVRAPLN